MNYKYVKKTEVVTISKVQHPCTYVCPLIGIKGIEYTKKHNFYYYISYIPKKMIT